MDQDIQNKLTQLANIADWFDHQEQVDLQKSLAKVKEATGLIKSLKQQLQDTENEFEEIKKELIKND